MKTKDQYEFFKNIKLTEDGYLLVSGTGGGGGGVTEEVEITINGTQYKIVEAPGTEDIVVKDNEGTPFGSLIGGEWIITIPSFTKTKTSLNGVEMNELDSGQTDNILVKDTAGNEVGELIGGEWIVPEAGGGSIATLRYFPLRNTSVNPVYGNTGNTGQSVNGQTYTFVPNDGLYFDSPPTNFQQLFSGRTTINDTDISMWNVSNITNMILMFYQASNFNRDISLWDVSNVTNMSGMFREASKFNQDIGSWNVSNTTNISQMFQNTTFNQDIGGWDVSNVTRMDSMFREASKFNQDIGSWNVSNVTNMSYMFNSASIFNQNLSGWCVTKITTLPNNFKTGSPLSVANTPVWGTCP